MNPFAEMLQMVAKKYFDGTTGDAEMLVNEFFRPAEFVEGQRQGHSDAYWILMGVADSFQEGVQDD